MMATRGEEGMFQHFPSAILTLLGDKEFSRVRGLDVIKEVVVTWQ